jgi:peptidoglycan/LPS O-acetylase OafA/YrhL
MNHDARDNNFNLVRLFGAMLVIYGHSYALTGQAAPGFAATSVSTIGVKIFFSISGYLVSKSWLSDPHLGRFFLRRALRIFPALIGLVLVTVFIAGPLLSRLSVQDYFAHPTTFRYLWNIPLYINYFLPGLFEKNVYPHAVNGSLWSLPTEFAMYMLTPVLLTALAFIHREKAVIGAAFAAVFLFAGIALWSSQIDRAAQPWVFYATDVWASLTLAPYFIMGMALAASRLERLFNIYIAFALLFILAIVETSPLVKEAMLIIILPYICLSFAMGRNLVPRIGGVDISYGLFLYGFLIQQVLASMVSQPMKPWTIFAISLFITALPAWLSWVLVEKPALNFKPRARASSRQVVDGKR